jgi:carbon-monoxide dehydrogenase small subunit
MILAAEALLRQNNQPTEAEVRAALAGNLCRCTGYNMIIEAVLLAAGEGGELWLKSTDL